MVKNKQLPRKSIDKAKIGAFLTRLGGGLKQIASTHPTALALTLMAASSVGLIIARKQADGKTWSRSAADELNGLYNGVAGITMAMAALPVVASVAGAGAEAVKAYFGKGALTSKPAPNGG